MKYFLIIFGFALYSSAAYSNEPNCETIKQNLLKAEYDIETTKATIVKAEANIAEAEDIIADMEAYRDKAENDRAKARNDRDRAEDDIVKNITNNMFGLARDIIALSIDNGANADLDKAENDRAKASIVLTIAKANEATALSDFKKYCEKNKD